MTYEEFSNKFDLKLFQFLILSDPRILSTALRRSARRFLRTAASPTSRIDWSSRTRPRRSASQREWSSGHRRFSVTAR